MARWTRAMRLLPPDTRRVLDLGCAFGFATRRLARAYAVVGVDGSPEYLRRAARSGGGPDYILGSAGAVPLRAERFDAVLLLDVLEHVADEAATAAEVARLLRPGGVLVLSVPHAGLLRWFDSINRCPELWNLDDVAPFRDVRGQEGEIHRHYRLGEIRRLLGPEFRIDHISRTGLGIAELVNIGLLWGTKRLLRMPWLYEYVQYLYFTIYLVEDLLPFGRWSYHLTIRAHRR